MINPKSAQTMDLRGFLANAGSSFFLDASPIYEEIRMKLTFSGTATKNSGDYTITLTGVIEETFTRVPLIREPDPLGGVPSSDEYTDYIPYVGNPSTGEVCMFLIRPGTWYSGISPVEQAHRIFPESMPLSEVIGTWSDTALGTSGDATLSGSIFYPYFWDGATFPADYERVPWAELATEFLSTEIAIGSSETILPLENWDRSTVDISGWTQADWRDQRGVRTQTFTDPSADSTLTVVVEWELS